MSSLLNTLEISKYIALTSRLSPKDWYVSWVKERSWLIHVSPGSKLDWVSDITLFFVKNSNILS